MRINKGICISVRNITFAFIMILKIMRKREERNMLGKMKNLFLEIRRRYRKKKEE